MIELAALAAFLVVGVAAAALVAWRPAIGRWLAGIFLLLIVAGLGWGLVRNELFKSQPGSEDGVSRCAESRFC